MKEKLYNLGSFFLRPIISDSLYFIFCMYAIRFLSNYLRGDICAMDYILYVSEIYILSLLLRIVNDKVRHVIEISLIIFTYLLNFIEVFLYKQFGLLYSTQVINLLLSTNNTEASGFVTEYFLSKTTLCILLQYVPILLITLLLKRFSVSRSPRNSFYHNRVCLAISVAIFTGMAATTIYWSKAKDFPINCIVHPWTKSNYSSELRLYQSIVKLSIGIEINNILFDRLFNYNETLIDTCSFQSPNIVFYLGESCVKRHFQYYGYSKETTPKMVSEINNGNLFLFTDAITSVNTTEHTIEHIFSGYGKDGGEEWAERPLFPLVFRLAGYNVSFLSNQYNVNSLPIVDKIGGFFLTKPRISELLFDLRNADNPTDDIELLSKLDSLSSYDNQLIIFQGMGMHTPFDIRCPANNRVFTASDYGDRTDLDYDQKQTVADYDNAVRYNDMVADCLLDKFRDKDAVVVFVSDHGEEVYDFNKKFGRQYVFSDDMIRSEYEIPMWIWCSDKYKHEHPKVVEQIKNAVDKPFISCDIPHLLYDLAGIECDSFNPSRSIINDNYDSDAERMIIIGYDGDDVRNYNTLFK